MEKLITENSMNPIYLKITNQSSFGEYVDLFRTSTCYSYKHAKIECIYEGMRNEFKITYEDFIHLFNQKNHEIDLTYLFYSEPISELDKVSQFLTIINYNIYGEMSVHPIPYPNLDEQENKCIAKIDEKFEIGSCAFVRIWSPANSVIQVRFFNLNSKHKNMEQQQTPTENNEQQTFEEHQKSSPINPFEAFPKPVTIKDFRQILDCCMNSVKYIRSSREVSLTYTNLQRAFMWIGESQKFTGSTSPYIHSQDPASTVIEPTADHEAENDFRERWDTLQTHTARVKDFRQILSFLISDFRKFIASTESAGKEYDDCINQSFLAMKEAKGWLGWELGRIKKEIDGTENQAPKTSLPL